MSKTVLFYFTGTGNSLAVARRIAEDLEDSVIISMLKEDAHKYITDDTQNIGLIYPIYMNAIPKVVARFIEQIKGITASYIFAIAIHGALQVWPVLTLIGC